MKCQPKTKQTNEATWNEFFRGRTIRVITPATSHVHHDVLCSGPFYWREDRRVVVCPHIAEIGD